MGHHARQQIRALSLAGIPLVLRALGQASARDSELGPEGRQLLPLANLSAAVTDLIIHHVVIHGDRYLEDVLLPRAVRLSSESQRRELLDRSVVYTSWERDRVGEPIVEWLNECAEVWVPCNRNREAFLNSGVKRVRTVPCPYDPEAPGTAQIPFPRGNELVPDGRRFYSIGKWEPRKNHVLLLRAFVRAFGPRDRASLLIKTSEWGEWRNYPSIERAMRELVHEASALGWTTEQLNRRIRIICDKLPVERIHKIHKENNIYVSASHGEAWDVPAFEAVSAGNRLLYTWGGPEDFATPAEDIQIPYMLAPCHQQYGWEPDAKWADVELDDLVSALRSAEAPERRRHPSTLYPRFGRYAVGTQMRSALADLLDATAPPEAAFFLESFA
jgi:glycosyltransferase involved in cell wall biosynthesis